MEASSSPHVLAHQAAGDHDRGGQEIALPLVEAGFIKETCRREALIHLAEAHIYEASQQRAYIRAQKNYNRCQESHGAAVEQLERVIAAVHRMTTAVEECSKLNQDVHMAYQQACGEYQRATQDLLDANARAAAHFVQAALKHTRDGTVDGRGQHALRRRLNNGDIDFTPNDRNPMNTTTLTPEEIAVYADLHGRYSKLQSIGQDVAQAALKHSKAHVDLWLHLDNLITGNCSHSYLQSYEKHLRQLKASALDTRSSALTSLLNAHTKTRDARARVNAFPDAHRLDLTHHGIFKFFTEARYLKSIESKKAAGGEAGGNNATGDADNEGQRTTGWLGSA